MPSDQKYIPLSGQTAGDDTTPLYALVPEQPPSHWGKLTSQPREESEQYKAFLKRSRDGKRK